MDSLVLRGSSHGQLYIAEEPDALDDARPTVYLDTTIPSYLVPRSSEDLLNVRRQRITRIWWERYRARFELRVSYRVIEEARAGDPHIAQRRVQILEPIAWLELHPQCSVLANYLVGPGLLPPKAIADAEHVAIAAIHSMRYMLTWNCKHLANPAIAHQVVRKCEQFGFICPEICTPEQLMRGCAHERSHH